MYRTVLHDENPFHRWSADDIVKNSKLPPEIDLRKNISEEFFSGKQFFTATTHENIGQRIHKLG